MSEINVHGDEVYYGEVVPGWHLVRLINKTSNRPFIINGVEMKEGNLGLTTSNDPTFIFEVEPIPDVSDDEWEAMDDESVIENLATWASYQQSISCCNPVVGYDLVKASIEVGYNLEEDDFVGWLCDRMYKLLQVAEPEIRKRVGSET